MATKKNVLKTKGELLVREIDELVGYLEGKEGNKEDQIAWAIDLLRDVKEYIQVGEKM